MELMPLEESNQGRRDLSEIRTPGIRLGISRWCTCSSKEQTKAGLASLTWNSQTTAGVKDTTSMELMPREENNQGRQDLTELELPEHYWE